jgi:hypothetical protein
MSLTGGEAKPAKTRNAKGLPAARGQKIMQQFQPDATKKKCEYCKQEQ